MTVEFDHISKSFGNVHALRDLTLTVEEGEFLVLVGPSGCGKTTALRIIAGLEQPTSGDLRIAGRSVLGVEPRDRDIAMVFQSYALYPHMSVYDNLAFGMRQRKTPKDEVDRRVREVAEMLQLTPLLRRRPRELSGGQRQRVALGRAISRRPKVFLLDEPLSNLDAQLRLKTRAELTDLHRRLGTTLVYVTHDQVEAMTMGHRIAILHQGVLQQVDTPQALYDRPANAFVATFIGSPAMNILAGRLSAAGGTYRFTASGIDISVSRPPADGEELLLGIRPEGFERWPRTLPAPVAGPVVLAEPHGPDLFVTVDAGGQRVTARLDPTVPARPGDVIGLAPLGEPFHWFRASDGSRLADAPLLAPNRASAPA